MLYFRKGFRSFHTGDIVSVGQRASMEFSSKSLPLQPFQQNTVAFWGSTIGLKIFTQNPSFIVVKAAK